MSQIAGQLSQIMNSVQRRNKPHILIINTGGTISCVKTKQGYQPKYGYVADVLTTMPTLNHEDMPTITIKEYSPLLDSSNINLHEWNTIASDIFNNYTQYDGFLIFHGTDTMAYTASALSFMLENLGKPVILTGSQIPLSEARNDAVDNIITSLWLCANQPIPEVCIYFNHRLLRGNRTKKVSAEDFNAIDSPNYPALATIGIDIELNHEWILHSPTEPLSLQTLQPHFIANFRIFPGFSTQVLASLLQQPLRALILETYGAGNAPNNDPHFLSLLTEASARGIILINSSQCQHGRVEMGQYATGATLKQAGLISAHDMTLEAVHCKLLYLFSKYKELTQIKNQMEHSLAGELNLA